MKTTIIRIPARATRLRIKQTEPADGAWIQNLAGVALVMGWAALLIDAWIWPWYVWAVMSLAALVLSMAAMVKRAAFAGTIGIVMVLLINPPAALVVRAYGAIWDDARNQAMAQGRASEDVSWAELNTKALDGLRNVHELIMSPRAWFKRVEATRAEGK